MREHHSKFPGQGLSGSMSRIVKKKIHTHYDNLKIARDAPDEVIRASYKALSQKYHPDKNPRPDAARIMAILNTSYAVLADEVQRRRHDDWIAEQEGARTPELPTRAPRERERAASSASGSTPPPENGKETVHATAYRQVEVVDDKPFWRNLHFDTPQQLALLLSGVLALTVLMIALLHDEADSPLSSLMLSPSQGTSRETAMEDKPAPKKQNGDMLAPFKTVTVAPTRIRFGVGPDGKPWPTGPRLYRDNGLQRNGLSTLIIDNSHNAHPVYVKISLDARPGEAELYIPRHRLYSLENLSPGTYRLKYRDLQSGMAAQSKAMPLGDVIGEASGPPGVVAVALRAMPADSRDFQQIPESQF
jgi:hypothetical protein